MRGLLLERSGRATRILVTCRTRIEGIEGGQGEQTPPPPPRRIGAAPRHASAARWRESEIGLVLTHLLYSSSEKWDDGRAANGGGYKRRQYAIRNDYPQRRQHRGENNARNIRRRVEEDDSYRDKNKRTIMITASPGCRSSRERLCSSTDSNVPNDLHGQVKLPARMTFRARLPALPKLVASFHLAARADDNGQGSRRGATNIWRHPDFLRITIVLTAAGLRQ